MTFDYNVFYKQLNKKAIWKDKKIKAKEKGKYCYIYIFRHGQTYFNKNHVFTGFKNPKLTPLGIKQAKLIGKKLRNIQIDVAFYTHVIRSRDTLKYVLSSHPECEFRFQDDRMIERCYGTLQGKSHEKYVIKKATEFYKTLLHWHKIDHLPGQERKDFIKAVGEAELRIIRRSYAIPPPGGESIKMVEKRVMVFIKDLLEFIKKNKVNVAISAHGNSMRPFRRYFEKLTIEEMMSLENPWDDYFEYKVKV